MASTSSIKMMAGAFSLAILKTSRTMRGPCKADSDQALQLNCKNYGRAMHAHLQYQGYCFCRNLPQSASVGS